MEIQTGIGVVPSPVFNFVASALVTHIVHDLTGPILSSGYTYIQSNAPVRQARILYRPTLYGKAFQETHAVARLRNGKGLINGLFGMALKREIVGCHFKPRFLSGLGVLQRLLNFDDGLTAEVVNP